jgi:hypothetical protein
MDLPKRSKQHISETASFKLFSSLVPNNWIVREMTERDYGIDCYIELVDDEDRLTGDLVLIQLKSRDGIDWTKEDYYTISGIDIQTSNYWWQFAVPVFIFLADIKNQELYFLSTHQYVRRNFIKYASQKGFSYRIKRTQRFDDQQSLLRFKYQYIYESHRKQFENELLFFLSNYESYKDFQDLHSNLDYHLGIETHDLIFFETMHSNFRFLTKYLNIFNIIPSLQEIKTKSMEKFGEESHYELYEHDLSELTFPFKRTTSKILKNLIQIIENESEYWQVINPTVLNYINELD